MTHSDRIEKTTLLRASRARVWRAISDAREFGAWFRMDFQGSFVEGETIRGRITHPGYEHLTVSMDVTRIEPMRYFAYRWHPYAIDPAQDYSAEPTTLVEFILDDSPDGVLLTIIESGFEHIPAARRAEAFRMNAGGWDAQLKNVAEHVANA